eukprot:CAMPEP_0194536234 /NCGR_PEP_ID=MMETSP0253-20130528/75078_1 /TAXON_ID=2966 /ORGANISM="Noctiluca scintillans" /LENGTH=378 /DNA_ID=CAMNT_0039382129 /DNA_START=63 /DNA_END=1199 /DNA_ORIENTATION=+
MTLQVFQPCWVQCDPDITCGTQWAFSEPLPDTQAWATPVFPEAENLSSAQRFAKGSGDDWEVCSFEEMVKLGLQSLAKSRALTSDTTIKESVTEQWWPQTPSTHRDLRMRGRTGVTRRATRHQLHAAADTQILKPQGESPVASSGKVPNSQLMTACVDSELPLPQCGADISGCVWRLSQTSRGCRVVQSLLETSSGVDKMALAEELKGHVLEAVESPSANFVLQRCIEVLPASSVQFILDELKGRAASVARHRFGCRILQRLLEHCPSSQLADLIDDEILSEAAALVRHKFGNFVFRHVIEHGTQRQRRYIVDVLEKDAFEFSKHRLASHVVQLALTYSDPEDRQRLTNAIASSAQVLKALAHTQYGSFVVREIHSRC